ncbi:unnamed protein product [Discula destructiva]
MATNGHEKKRSFGSGSGSDLTPGALPKLPRPASRASTARPAREAPTLRESLQFVADRNRLTAQGSPSPAPRPYRQTPSSAGHRPLAQLFPDKPIELGRAASKRPRRDGTLAAKTSIGSLSHNDGDTDEEFERKLKKFEADDKLFETLLKEERNGAFAKRKIIGSSIARPVSARGGAINHVNGSRDGPPQVFAETGYGRQHTDMYHRLQQLEKNPEALANHYSFLTGTDPGAKRSSYQQAGDMPGHRPSNVPPGRSATTAPSMPGSSWEIEEDFTARDMQGSTSPPVSFGRSNTRIDEIRQRELDAERRFSSPNKPRFLQRNNTLLEEIARLEKEVLQRYPDESVSSLTGDLPMVEDQPEGERKQAARIAFKSRIGEVKERIERERLASHRLLSAAADQRKSTHEAHDVPQPSSLHESPKSKATSQRDSGFDDKEGGETRNPPVTDYNGGTRSNPKDENEKPAAKSDAPTLLQQQPTPPKEDSPDLVQHLASASNKIPNPTTTVDEAAREPFQEGHAEAESVPEGKVASEYRFLKASKPAVGFTGISRSNSTNSISSKASVLSGDPSARIAAEAKLFALDNFSERSSLRAPSPVLDFEAEIEAGKEITSDKEDDTPRPVKFADPIPAPTPVVTGAFVDTPAPAKLAHDVEEVPEELPSRPESLEKTTKENRDPSTSPRASKSDVQREPARQRSVNDVKRSKSSSRHRSSPVKNTAKLPSVKDDLRQIYQRNNIDDSEVDDLTGLVLGAEDPEEVVQILKTEVPKLDDDTKDLPIDEQLRRMNGMSEALKTGLAQIRNAKRGIERLEGQVSHPGKATRNSTQSQPFNRAHSLIPDTRVHRSDSFMYFQLPVPKLYRRAPKLRPTLTGFIMLLLCFWQLYWFVEGLFYNQWGKQTVCYRGETCRWDMDDPEYGYVIPVKLDEWITGGAIRPHAARWVEEAQDGWADLEDWLTDTDIRRIHHQAIKDPIKKMQYWRRIEKKGLFPKWRPAAWLMPEIEEWEREAADASVELDEYDVDDRDEPVNDSMDKDQPISRDPTVRRLW